MVLLRVLPDGIKTPALEADEGEKGIDSLRLLGELYLCVRPGGIEEQQTLVKFMRQISPVNTAREAIELLRCWRLAKNRIASLKLPEIPAYEQIRGIQTLLKNLERKHDSIRTRLSLVRLHPDIHLARPQGVVMMLDAVEQELRQIAADEMTKDNLSNNSDAVINQGKSGDQGKGKGEGKGKGKAEGKGKQANAGAPNPPKGTPKGKAKSDKPDGKDKQKRKCIFHPRKSGCRLGDSCPFAHEGPSGASKANTEGAPALVGAEAQKANAKAGAKAKPKAAAKAALASVVSSFVGMLRSGPPSSNPFPHRQIPSWPLWICELTADQYRLWQQHPHGMTGYFTNAENLDRARQDLEADLWINLNESNLEIWYEGWLQGQGTEMYADHGMIEAQVVSAWNCRTSGHEPGFLVATETDTSHPRYRVLILSPERPGTDRSFNDLQQRWFELDALVHVTPENHSINQHEEGEYGSRSSNTEASTPASCPILSPMSTVSSEPLEDFPPQRGLVWCVHLGEESFRNWLAPGVLGVNAEDPFVPVIGDEGMEARAWRALIASRRRHEPPDAPIPIGHEQHVTFTQEVQVQVGAVSFTRCFAVCVSDGQRNDIMLGLCMYPSRPWITLSPITFLPNHPGAPAARAPTVPMPPDYDNIPEINSVMHGATSDGGVLLDSGANEILRQENHRPSRSHHLPLTLANGASIDAYRTKEGEVVVVGDKTGELICGVNRLVQVGCRFEWDYNGPRLHLPSELDSETVQLREVNGLPFMSKHIFLKLRPLMTRHWKTHHCVKAAVSLDDELGAEVCQLVSWNDLDSVITFQEETACKAVADSNGEEFAEKLLSAEPKP